MDQKTIESYKEDLKIVDEDLGRILHEKWDLEKRVKELEERESERFNQRRVLRELIMELKLEGLGVAQEELFDETN